MQIAPPAVRTTSPLSFELVRINRVEGCWKAQTPGAPFSSAGDLLHNGARLASREGQAQRTLSFRLK